MTIVVITKIIMITVTIIIIPVAASSAALSVVLYVVDTFLAGATGYNAFSLGPVQFMNILWKASKRNQRG